MNCPNCSTPMESLATAGIYGPEVNLDLCFACHVMWFDKRESIQLSPRGTLDLFRVLHDHREDARHSLGNRLACPRCRRRLSLSHDIGKAGRFSYYSCPARDGRLTPFSEFLKEKQFVRELNPAEQSRLRAEVKHVQCSNCGAPVDVSGGFQCGHCGSAITVLDADAVENTLRELAEAAAHRSGPPEEKEARARARAAMEALRRDSEDPWKWGAAPRHQVRGDSLIDILTASIGAIFGGL